MIVKFVTPASRRLLLIIVIFTGAYAADASAFLTPDWNKIEGKTLPDVAFFDAKGQQLRLSDYKGKILILHPMFSHCHSTCPIIAAAIEKAYKGLPESEKAKIRILSFSFDPGETDQGLAGFQKANAKEHNWDVVRASSDQIGKLFDALDFRTLQLSESNFEHANLVFILSGDRVLRDYVLGSDLTPQRLMRSIQIAGGTKTVSRSGLLIFAAIGLLISTFVFVTLWTKKK